MSDTPQRNDLPVEALQDDEELTTVRASGDGNLVIAGFELTPTRLIPTGEPSFEEWDQVGHFLRYVHTGSQFWIGDWINYGEQRYGEKYTQALTRTGYSLGTLETYAWVARHVAPEKRKEKIPFGHYVNTIAALEPSEQDEWIDRVLEHDMTQAELRTAVRLSKRRKVAESTELPPGTYRIIVADNPWSYDDSGEIKGTAYGKAERHYPTMTIEELVTFYSGLKDRGTFARDSVLFMWVPAPLVYENPGPREVIEAAGFRAVGQFIWWKDKHVYGHYNSVQHELLFICVHGSCTPDEPTPMPASVIKHKLTKELAKHSAKPDIFFDVIDRLYPIGSRLELFGRKQRSNWVVYGNDPDVATGKTNQQPNEAAADDPSVQAEDDGEELPF